MSPSPLLDHPLITIAMPTLNRSAVLAKSLEALLNLDYPKELIRIVFVDGHSTDGTYKLLTEFQVKHAGEYRGILVIQSAGNIPVARNICVKNSDSNGFMVFVDSDVIVEPTVLRRLIDLSKIGGITSIAYGLFGNRTFADEEVSDVAGGCTLIRRDVIEKVGLFDVTLRVGEDADYCYRATREGFRIMKDSTLRLSHLNEPRYARYERLWWRLIWMVKYRRYNSKMFRFKSRSSKLRIGFYGALDCCIILGVLGQWPLLLVPVSYFGVQLIKRRNLTMAAYFSAKAVLIPFVHALGMVERHLVLWGFAA